MSMVKETLQKNSSCGSESTKEIANVLGVDSTMVDITGSSTLSGDVNGLRCEHRVMRNFHEKSKVPLEVLWDKNYPRSNALNKERARHFYQRRQSQKRRRATREQKHSYTKQTLLEYPPGLTTPEFEVFYSEAERLRPKGNQLLMT